MARQMVQPVCLQAGYWPPSSRAMSECDEHWAGGLQAEKEADVIIWDGGNNDTPFFKPGVLTHPQHMACNQPAVQRQLRHISTTPVR